MTDFELETTTAGLRRIRGWILALFILGMLGAASELLLLEHYEDAWQWTPLVVLAGGMVTTAWYLRRPGPASTRAFRSVMLAFIGSGLLGLYLHFAGNAEFELEMSPGLGGLTLFREAVTGATPALAPATMVHLGLLGMLSTWALPDTLKAGDPDE